MAERLAALAGYSNSNNAASDSDYSISQSVNLPHPHLQDTANIESLDQSHILPPKPINHKPLQRRKTEIGAPGNGNRNLTPNSKHNNNTDVAPDTERKPDNRKGFAVRISNDDNDQNNNANGNGKRIVSGGIGGAKRIISNPKEALDSLEDESEDTSDLELKMIQRDFSMGQDTNSFNDDGEGQSLLGGDSENMPSSSDTNNNNRRKSQGTVKTSTERINNLIKERDDLKIELDYHRRKMSVEDQGHEIIALTRIVHSNKVKISELTSFVNRQDSNIKGLNKENRRLKKSMEGEGDLGQLKEELKRLKEENDVLKGRERDRSREFGNEQDQEIQNLREQVDNLNEDHRSEIHQLNVEKDNLADELDRAHDEIQALKDDLDNQDRDRDQDQEEELERLRTEREEDKVEIQKLNSEINKVSDSLEMSNEDRRILKEENGSLRDNVLRLEELVDGLNEKMDRMGEVSMDQEENRREEINGLKDQLTASEIEIEKLKGEIDDYANERLEETRLREDLEDKIAAQGDELRDMEDQFLQLKEEFQNLETENQTLDEHCARLEEDAKALVEDFNALEAQKQELVEEVEDLKVLLDNKEEDLTQTNRELGESTNARIELERIIEEKEEEMRHFQTEMTYAEQNFDERYSILTKTNNDIQLQLRETRQSLEIKLDELARAEQDLDDYKKDLDQAQIDNENLLKDLKLEEDQREAIEEELTNKLDDKDRQFSRDLQDKEEELQHVLSDLQSRSKELEISKQDLAVVQEALRKIENDTAKLGQSQANDKHSLELEIDRLKRDIGRVEEELERTKKELERKEESSRNKDKDLEKMYSENRDMSSKLASETQARLGLDERFDVQLKAYKSAQEEVEALKTKIEELEEELSRGERTNQQSEQQTSAALSERNTFLMYIYQQLDKIVGADKNTPRKRREDVKPFTNFAIFHDLLVAQLKALGKIPSQFEERAKIVESKFAAEMKALKRTQEERFRKLDACEKSIKTAILKQSSWRAKVQQKEGECTSKQNTINELNIQISSMRSRLSSSNPDDVQRIKKLTLQIRELERKLADQEKQMNNESMRIRELKIRCEAAEERTKTIETGGRARVKELTDKNRLLEKEKKDLIQKQVEVTQAHNDKIDEVRKNESR